MQLTHPARPFQAPPYASRPGPLIGVRLGLAATWNVFVVWFPERPANRSRCLHGRRTAWLLDPSMTAHRLPQRHADASARDAAPHGPNAVSNQERHLSPRQISSRQNRVPSRSESESESARNGSNRSLDRPRRTAGEEVRHFGIGRRSGSLRQSGGHAASCLHSGLRVRSEGKRCRMEVEPWGRGTILYIVSRPRQFRWLSDAKPGRGSGQEPRLTRQGNSQALTLPLTFLSAVTISRRQYFTH